MTTDGAGVSTDAPQTKRLPETNRVEAFSDGVLAIAVTLLVLDLHSDFTHGKFAHELGTQWPAYVAYLAAFLNVSAIWINHHDLFNRVNRADAGVVSLNLVVLLVASLFPWPTAVVSSALLDGDEHDQVAACVLYAGIGFLVPLTFIAMFTYLLRAPHLLADSTQLEYVRVSRRRALVSIVVYPITVALATVSVDAALALFVAVPLFFISAVFVQERAERGR